VDDGDGIVIMAHPKENLGDIVSQGLKLSLAQRLQLKVTGAVPTERRSHPGWKGELQFYAFRCPVHGLVENYPQGYGEVLVCPECKTAS
jgi:hypothetical protein